LDTAAIDREFWKSVSILLLILALLVAQSPSVTGRWLAAEAYFYGTPIDFSMELDQQGDKFNGWRLVIC
jgi:hypothetical protein